MRREKRRRGENRPSLLYSTFISVGEGGREDCSFFFCRRRDEEKKRRTVFTTVRTAETKINREKKEKEKGKNFILPWNGRKGKGVKKEKKMSSCSHLSEGVYIRVGDIGALPEDPKGKKVFVK